MMFNHTIGLACSLQYKHVCRCAKIIGEEWSAEVQRFIDASIQPYQVWGKSYQECFKLLPEKLNIEADIHPETILANMQHKQFALDFLAQQGVLRTQNNAARENVYDYISRSNENSRGV